MYQPTRTTLTEDERDLVTSIVSLLHSANKNKLLAEEKKTPLEKVIWVNHSHNLAKRAKTLFATLNKEARYIAKKEFDRQKLAF